MPTLRVTTRESMSSSSTFSLRAGGGDGVGETATTVDFALFSDLPRRSMATAAAVQHSSSSSLSNDEDNDLNDTTLSGSLLEEALEILRAEKETQLLLFQTQRSGEAATAAAASQTQQQRETQAASVPANAPGAIHVEQQQRLRNIIHNASSTTKPQERTMASSSPTRTQAKPPALTHECAADVVVQVANSLIELDRDNDDSCNDVGDYSCDSFDLPPPPRVIPDSEKTTRMGPMELVYREKYAGRVATHIQNSKHKLRDYRTMNDAEKEKEQERVLALLHRLGISSNSHGGGGDGDDNERETGTTIQGARTQDGVGIAPSDSKQGRTSEAKGGVAALAQQDFDGDDGDMDITIDPDLANAHDTKPLNTSRSNKSVTFALGNDEAMPLFSPPQRAIKHDDHEAMETSELLLSPPDKHARKPQPPHQYSSDEDSSSTSGDDSIEIPRSHRQIYDSPDASTALHQRKRMASTSGKRGSDLTRARSTSPSNYGLPVASVQPKLFSLSQSPISPFAAPPHRDSHDSFAQRDVSFGGDSSSDEDNDKNHTCRPTAEAHDSILSPASYLMGGRQPLRENSNDVRLKPGEVFFLQPLETTRTRQEHFPDPFQLYDGKVARKLVRVYDKLRRREDALATKPNSTARAIVMSMEMQLIHDLVLKLIMERADSCPLHSPHKGNTLIVAREREQLDEWTRTFREGSSLSVLNHATLPVAQRKTRSTADKCSKYDVVLSTFDCLKSPDVTLNLDKDGFASINSSGQDGWYSSKNTPSQTEGVQCKQLSVLHCLQWKRVVFVDVVGRKCFLVKPETSRALASRSLNSNVRCMFFTGPEDGDCDDPLTTLLKGDRKSVEALASVLRASIDGCEEEFLRHVIIDLHRRSKKGQR